MPPDLRTFCGAPFGAQERVRLTAWLTEGAWPRDHMGMAELEGYLLGLIAWPVGIAAGAWLPPLWGGRGWRIPAKLVARSQYEEFVSLIVGYMRDLDVAFCQPSPLQYSVLKDDARAENLHRWGRGFMTALTLGSQGMQGRSESARSAVLTIAGNTCAGAPFRPHAVDEVVDGVVVLMSQRPSRGPLGPLEPSASLIAPIEHTSQVDSGATPRNSRKRSH